MCGDEKLRITRGSFRKPILPTVNALALEPTQPSRAALYSSVYVIIWIALSSNVILFNKYILCYKKFHYPIILTTWHLIFASIVTQIMAHTTRFMDGRKYFKMTPAIYSRTIVPIGLFFSLSLICGNFTYLYLSVAFIQMLKATTPVAVLLASWIMGLSSPNVGQLGNVIVIVVGVIIATFGEIEFRMAGFLFQCGGIVFEAIRLVLVQRLLNGSEYKMDPLVSLYYFAPLCAFMNAVAALFIEVPYLKISEVHAVGIPLLILNAMIAFLLNVSVVFLIGRTSSLVFTLCGVLKDVLLVAASMMIWGTPVTNQQFMGYTIALCGLIYYKVGREQLRSHITASQRSWARYGANHPVRRKITICTMVTITVLLIGHGLATRLWAQYEAFTYLSTRPVGKSVL